MKSTIAFVTIVAAVNVGVLLHTNSVMDKLRNTELELARVRTENMEKCDALYKIISQQSAELEILQRFQPNNNK